MPQNDPSQADVPGAAGRRWPVVLCILDGWGERRDGAANAIARARKPNWDRLMATCPHGVLNASEGSVGLPDGQMGNSEVGHMTIGAGRVVMQDLPRIDRAIASGVLAEDPKLRAFLARLVATKGKCHLMGLLSPGGVHSHQGQMAALAQLVAAAGVPVAVHAFLDGRDTPPKSAAEFLATFAAAIAGAPGAHLATLCGRFYAMDRDRRWDRVLTAYELLVDGRGTPCPTAMTGIATAYQRGETDEFVTPTVLDGFAGMADGDGVLMANFRADRARELLSALLDPGFDGFARPRRPAFAAALGLIEYSPDLNLFIDRMFAPESLANGLGELVSHAGMTQLRLAETEKYAHVTFFFNGGREAVFAGEERIMVPSPKVKTYDLKPEMSAFELADRLAEAIRARRFDLIVVNFANADMVGHTGNLDAATRAIEALDQCLGRMVEAIEEVGGVALITADHGNAELMLDALTREPHTAHTLNLVPAVLVNGPPGFDRLSDGALADIAPTVLQLLGRPQPPEMTGRSLLGGAPATAPGD